MKALTVKQRKVLRFIMDAQEEGNAPPTLEEIQGHFGWRAIGTVQDHIQALIKKGYLKRGAGARSLEVLQDPDFPFREEEGVWVPSWEERKQASNRSRLIPVVGEVAAGRPILAVENVEGGWFLDRKLLKGKDNFLLKVKGESMTGAQIRDGDYVLVRPQATAESGEIVVARAEDEVTVKRFYQKKGRIELRPENPSHQPIIFQKGQQEVEIIGKVIGVLRKY